MVEAHPSYALVIQRVRNRLIEALSTQSSFEEQLKCYNSGGIDANEIINSWYWEDGMNDLDERAAHVFSDEERLELDKYNVIWRRVVASTPNPLPPIEECQRLPEWIELTAAAHSLLSVFMKRGRLPED